MYSKKEYRQTLDFFLSLHNPIQYIFILKARILNRDLPGDAHVFLENTLLSKNGEYSNIGNFDLYGRLLISINSFWLTNDAYKDGITIEFCTIPETVRFNITLKIINEKTFRMKYANINHDFITTINLNPNLMPELNVNVVDDVNPQQIDERASANNEILQYLGQLQGSHDQLQQTYDNLSQANANMFAEILALRSRLLILENAAKIANKDGSEKRGRLLKLENITSITNGDASGKTLNTLSEQNLLVEFFHNEGEEVKTASEDFINFVGAQADVCFKQNEKIFINIKNNHEFSVHISVNIIDSSGQCTPIFPGEKEILHELLEKNRLDNSFVVIEFGPRTLIRSSDNGNFDRLFIYACNSDNTSTITIVKTICFK